MFNKEEILARLREGETIDDIANDLVAALNEAEKMLEAENKAKQEQAEAEAKRLEKEAQLDALIDVIIDSIINYIKIAAPELAEYMSDKEFLSTVSMRETLDGLLEMYKLIAAAYKPTRKEEDKEEKVRGKRVKTEAFDEVFDVDAILDSWIKSLK